MFGFLCVGEMTAPQQGVFDPTIHLGFADMAVDNPMNPSFIRVTIKQSKTDPFCQGVQLFLGRTCTDLCPVAAMLGYIDVRGLGPGPLFRFADGAGLTRSHFVAQIRDVLRNTGVDESRYNGHSFRIGAATTAAARGIEDSVIKRWTGGKPRPTCNMYGSLAVSSWATSGCWGPRRMTVSHDCPPCQLVVVIFFKSYYYSCLGGRRVLDPSLGRAGGRVALSALLPPAALYGWHIREAYIL